MNLDIIGKMYEITGDAENPTVTELEGWHVNTTEEVEEWEAYKVNPSHKRRVFAGVEKFCYLFQSEIHFKTLLPETEE